METPTCDKLKEIDSRILLRVISSSRVRTREYSTLLEEINRANTEIDNIGDIGLTVRFEKVKLLTTSEWFEWLGRKGNFYIITSILDGSGRQTEYTTRYFEGIKRDDFLPLGEGGLLVGYLVNPKWFIDIHMVIMESDSEIRNFGKYIEEARKESELDKLIEEIKDVASITDPRIRLLLTTVDQFLSILTYTLKKNGDDHVATIHDSYLKVQKFGEGRHPKEGLQRFQNAEVAYWIELSKL